MSSSACKTHFSSAAARLETFKYYGNSKERVNDLVESGFVLEIDNRSATCFNCGICFDIEKHTDFKTVHIKLSPNCTLISESRSARDAKKMEARVKHLKPVTYYQRKQAPYNDKFIDCYYRLKSLPPSTGNNKKIARAGFYKATNKYICFECGVHVRSFDEQDPWKLHCKLSANCAHLLINRGFFFIQKHQ